MRSAERSGRLIGLLILVQVLSGPLVYFVLLRPITTPPGFLENAAVRPLQLGVGVVVSLLTGAVSVGLAVAAWPVLRPYGSRMALWLLSLGVVSLSLIAVEGVTVMSMVSLSQAYAAADAAQAGALEGVAVVVRAARRWAHVTNLLVGGGMILVLYGALYRLALVPRPLAAVGLAAVTLHIAAVTAGFFGHWELALMIPLALSYLALALWLMAKGFQGRGPSGGGAPGVVELSGG